MPDLSWNSSDNQIVVRVSIGTADESTLRQFTATDN